MIYMKFASLEPFGELIQAVSTRMGGMSNDPYATLNLGFHTGDVPDKVLLNREILCNRLNIALDCLVCARQVHGGDVAIVQKEDWGKGSEDYESALDAVDGMITDAPAIFLMVLVADCPGVVFYDPKRKAVGVAHAGWRSTLAGISRNVVAKMKESFKCKPEDILCGISPSIGPCCYEVGEDVVQSFVGQGFSPERSGRACSAGSCKPVASPCIEKREGKFFLNLWQINRRQLIESGVKDEHIEIARLCNSCHSDLFYSARKEGKTGRYGVLIGRRKS